MLLHSAELWTCIMKFPIEIKFKILTLVNQFTATDSTGKLVYYVRQKFWKLKEHVNVFADKEQNNLICDIKANKVIDWSAKYTFTTPEGEVIGAVARSGMKSLWKAHYEIFDADDNQVMQLREVNAWVKFFDGLVGEIPIIGALTGYFLNPKYEVKNMDGESIFLVTKTRTFLEGKFKMEEMRDVEETQDMLGFLSVLMMILLERRRG